MNRLATEIKGLVIDLDSFTEEQFDVIEKITQQITSICIVADNETYTLFNKKFPTIRLQYIETFQKVFFPSKQLIMNITKNLSLPQSQFAYVSADLNFINNSLTFLSPSILISSSSITHSLFSCSADYIYKDLNQFSNELTENPVGLIGYLGEAMFNPKNNIRKGRVVSYNLSEDSKVVTFGRYFSYSHYMNQIHPYSSAIYLNKLEKGKAFGIFNEKFTKLYSLVIQWVNSKIELHCICSVPVRSTQTDRFQEIVTFNAEHYNLENVSNQLEITRDYRTQKGLNQTERIENVENVFAFNGTLEGKNVVLIDDIITTGATIKACIKALKNKGANKVIVLVLATNQFFKSYWSSNLPLPVCDLCGSNMRLLINSSSKLFFYSCRNYPECSNSIDFLPVWEHLIKTVDSESYIEG